MTRHSRVPLWGLGLVFLLALPVGLAAGGGPRNVLVVINEDSPESVEIAGYYVQMREIPAANICRIRTVTDYSTTKAIYQDEIETPVMDCIAASPYSDRIDYIVLTRGMPIRASFPGGNVSTAALLQVMDTTLRGKDQEYNPPTFVNYRNGYRLRDEHFSHSKFFGGHQLYIVTMLSGFNVADAKSLVDLSLASDRNPPSDVADATFYYENASGNAGVRNARYPAEVIWMRQRGFDAEHIIETAPDVTGAVVASHMNGGSYSQISRDEIDSNTYPPGCIVDVLESFGLVPRNFDDDDDFSQTPVTWWVAAGVTAAHGTVSEPYNVAFPDANMLRPYVQGYNVGETFYQGMPYLYWMNLVLGDPLAAPWAEPPVVSIDAPAGGATVNASVSLEASALTTKPEGIARIEFFLDDTLVHTAVGDAGQTDWDSTTVADGWHRFEAVAYESTKYYTQATAGIDIVVSNSGIEVTITDPPDGTWVTGTFPVTVEASPSIVNVRVESGGTPVGSAAGGSPFVIDVDPGPLSRGWHSLLPIGEDGEGGEVTGVPLDVYVEKPPQVTLIDPVEGPQSGGTLVFITGADFDPGIRVFFGAGASTDVTRINEGSLEAVTPTGPAGLVEVRLVNPAGSSVSIPDGFTYVAGPCPVTGSVEDTLVSKGTDLRLLLQWTAPADPCLESYRVLAVANPVPASPPGFPGDFLDLTDMDEDGDPGGDTGFLHTPSAQRLVLYQVAGRGTDGGLGPR